MSGQFILGVSCFHHDAAAALVCDGRVIAAAAEERFSRVKHDVRFPWLSISFCLEEAGLNPGDLHAVVFYEKPSRKVDRVLSSIARSFPRSFPLFKSVLTTWGSEKLWFAEMCRERLKVPTSKVFFSEHHLSHAAHGYFLAPFDDAAILTLDGVGEWATSSFGTGIGNRIERTGSTDFPHSLGLFYSAFTEFLGFEVNEGEYKVMGMAPYGSPRYYEKVMGLFAELSDEGFRLKTEYFTFGELADSNLTQRFIEEWGEPRRREEPFFLPQFASDTDEATQNEEISTRSQYYADVAASVQKVTEDIILRLARGLKRRTGLDRLIFCGGVANNSVANGRLIRESGFAQVYVPPGPGDDGAAIGAALAFYGAHGGVKRQDEIASPYLGQSESEEEVRTFLQAAGVSFREVKQEQLAAEVAALLDAGKVIGWVQDRFEFGPRALGARSILADPRSHKMKSTVNAKVKFRELFRPFAPAVHVSRIKDYYEMSDAEAAQTPYRYMQSMAKVKDQWRDKLQAVSHVDGSARAQAVEPSLHPLFANLLQEFEKRSGVAVLLNTSFNRRGEPIVNTVRDALETFEWTGIDHLVAGNCVVSRR